MVKKVKARKTRKQKGGVFGSVLFGKKEMSKLMYIITKQHYSISDFKQRETAVNKSVTDFLNGKTEEDKKSELCMVRNMGWFNGSKTALDYVFAEIYIDVLKTLLDKGILKCPNININNAILYRLKQLEMQKNFHLKKGSSQYGNIHLGNVTWFIKMVDTVLEHPYGIEYYTDQVKLKELVIGFSNVLKYTYIEHSDVTQMYLQAVLRMVKPCHNRDTLNRDTVVNRIILDKLFPPNQGIYRTLWNKLDDKKNTIKPDTFMSEIEILWVDTPKDWDNWVKRGD
jgi:hypothetical protein